MLQTDLCCDSEFETYIARNAHLRMHISIRSLAFILRGLNSTGRQPVKMIRWWDTSRHCLTVCPAELMKSTHISSSLRLIIVNVESGPDCKSEEERVGW